MKDDLIDLVRPSVREEQLNLDIDGWEGPLDLLLQLARQQKVDLAQISILQLTEQYLVYIAEAKKLRLELAADYLVMAAWLAYLKSALLLPKEEGEEPSAEEMALRLQLRLQRLEAMREAGARLFARDLAGEDVFLRGAPEGLSAVTKPEWDCSLYDVMQAYGRLAGRGQTRNYEVKRRPVLSLDDAMDWLEKMVGSAVEWGVLQSFLPKTLDPEYRRSVIASSFVAALELARTGKLLLDQPNADAPLRIKAT
ncbi:segregation/condensation protein A [Pacificimonas sp. WHA3]|uniref:Segregation and condensation protein A n=1 Tax=Pacificimonas pallii TaxID=2827236 RepID=A0ABS6SEP6_9SPHN|nr:ScpA family protein [Pacificimonas pallii]MBV7256867.1 segregation/condensation protein A [Pacificimonas pallii]